MPGVELRVPVNGVTGAKGRSCDWRLELLRPWRARLRLQWVLLQGHGRHGQGRSRSGQDQGGCGAKTSSGSPGEVMNSLVVVARLAGLCWQLKQDPLDACGGWCDVSRWLGCVRMSCIS